MFTAQSMFVKVLIVLGALIIIGGGLAWAYKTVEASGYRRAQVEITEKISKENTNAGNNAESWRDKLRACNRDGGLYDFASNTCER